MAGFIITFDSQKGTKNLKFYTENTKTVELLKQRFLNVRVQPMDDKKYKLSYGYDTVDGKVQYSLVKRKS